MQIITNEPLVQRNRKIATFLFFFSLIVLGAGFIVANGQIFGLNLEEDETGASAYLVFMPIVLLVGFISTMISVRMTNLWVRLPRPEESLKVNLKGLSHKSRLYNYYHSPARHVLVSPHGIFVIVTRFQDGKFSVSGDKWKTKRSVFGRLFSFFRMDDLGDPTREAKQAAEHIGSIVEGYDPELNVQPLILFIGVKVDLNIDNPTVPVLYADSKLQPNIKDYLRDIQKAKTMNGPEDIDDFVEAFEEATFE
jgi:hypothetical protein